MDLSKLLEQMLGVRSSHINATSKDKVICLAHENWLQQLVKERAIPSAYIHQEQLSDSESELLLHQPASAIRPPWMRLTVFQIKKLKDRCVPVRLKEPWNRPHDLNYFELIHYISETNYRNMWKDANIRYAATESEKPSSKSCEYQDYNAAVREILNRLYNCPIICCDEDSTNMFNSSCPEGTSHPNLLPVWCIVEAEDRFLIFQEFCEFTVCDCVMFSSAVFSNSNSRYLFIVYQLLHTIRYIHDLGLNLGSVSLKDIAMNENFWLQITPRWWEALEFDSVEKSALEAKKKDFVSDSKNEDKSSKEGSHSMILKALVEKWVTGRMSNYDYLMQLNKLAGRHMNNPRYHPVLPWIMDFSVPDGGWRDLTKSKFRLTRGDRQLDVTYESSCTNSTNPLSGEGTFIPVEQTVQVPHHISEILSDITYYVYKARRMPKAVLCQHVRQKWVPAEYPASVQRLQEWSPNECIPEFFTDPEIFTSIHDDLPDLEVPWWCDGSEEFVKKHMVALESERVSEHLHHWIDLTFGYKLTGNAAIKSKNVCLPLVDSHTSLHNCGVVQLFSTPHPHKAATSLFVGRRAPKTFRFINQKHSIPVSSRKKSKDHSEKDSTPELKESGDEDSLSESSGGKKRSSIMKSRSMSQQLSTDQQHVEIRPEHQTVILPKDYNPLLLLNQLESFYLFNISEAHVPAKTSTLFGTEVVHHRQHHRTNDMYILGCLIAEIALFSCTSSQVQHLSLEDRYHTLLKAIKWHINDIPRCLQRAVKLLLQLDKHGSTSQKERHFRYPSVTPDGLPPPSAHQLLQSLIPTIPFPIRYKVLYAFLSEMNQYSHALYRAPKDSDANLHAAIAKVSHAAKHLPALCAVLTKQDLEFFLPHIEEMFVNPETSLLSVWHLFEYVAQALGAKQMAQTFLKVLIKLFDPDVPSAKHMKLYHRSFLLQLIVRLGLQTFLQHFSTLLVEAVGGYRDFLFPGCHRNSESSEVVTRKGSHLNSAELDSLIELDSRPEENCVSPQTANIYMPGDQEQNTNDDFEPEMFVLEPDQEVPKATKDEKEEENEEEIYQGTMELIDTTFEHVWQDHDNDEERDEEKPDRIGKSANEEYFFLSKDYIQQEGSYSISLPHANHMSSPSHHSFNEISQEQSSATPLLKREEAAEHISLQYNISDVAAESVIWLAHRLGPVLTAKHLTRNLLRMLTLCYLGPDQLSYSSLTPPDNNVNLSGRWIIGDYTANKVLESLATVATLYGESFITLQYLSHVADLLHLCKKHITETLEAGLVGAITLVKHILPYLSDTTLMNYLQDSVLKNILYPFVQLVSSLHHSFPGGAQVRRIITLRIADTLYLIGLRIGFEMSRKHLSAVLQRFFSSFDRAFNNGNITDVQHLTPLKGEFTHSCDDYLDIKKDGNSEEYKIGTPVSFSCAGSPLYQPSPPLNIKGTPSPTWEKALDEIKEVFTSELAYITYIPLCKLAGGIYMEHTLKNNDLIRQLCIVHDSNLQQNASTDLSQDSKGSHKKTHHRIPSAGQDELIVSGEFGKNVAMVGNRIDVHLGEESHLVAAGENPLPVSETGSVMDVPKYDINVLIRKMTNSQRHLKGNWLAYWEHEIGRSDKDQHFNFKQIKLQSFTGHNGSIRAIYVLNNENSFLTSSKDKTVKLWSLRSCGDGSSSTPCQWTYMQHKKSVFSVSFLDSLRLVGSCDSTIHIWDPFMGSCLKQLDTSKGHPVTALLAMPAPSATFLTATTNSTVRFLDARTCRYMHEFKVTIGAAGIVRCLAVSPNGYWLAVGHSSGMISVLDVRTGLMFGSWIAHEGEILQLKAFNNTYFVSSSLDHSVTVWNAEDTKQKHQLKGPTEPVTCLNFYQGEVISGTTANRINVHSAIDSQATFTSTKLRSDTFKGVLTSMAVLPLNRLLLLGADNGSVALLC